MFCHWPGTHEFLFPTTLYTLILQCFKCCAYNNILDVKTVHGVFIWKIPEIAECFHDA